MIVTRGKRDAGALQNIPPAPTPRTPHDTHTVADPGPVTLRIATKIETEIKRGRESERGTMKETGIGTGGEMTGIESETETPEEEMNEGEIGMKISGGQAAEREAVQRGAEEAVTGETERKRWLKKEIETGTGEEILDLLYPRPFRISMALIFLRSNVPSLLPPLQQPPHYQVHHPIANGTPAADPRAQTNIVRGRRNEGDDQMIRRERMRSTGADPGPPPSRLLVIMDMNQTVSRIVLR